MATPLIQLALDSLDFEQTMNLAEKTAPYIDIFEIGTPCIKHNGIDLVKALRAKFPDKLLLVDLKTMDAGEYEAAPFYAAGRARIFVPYWVYRDCQPSPVSSKPVQHMVRKHK
jgi:3-keto-L-gulonate-6-phosphate decarboxylase